METLFAFVDAGDTLSARSAEQDSVETIGEFATGIDNPFDNLVAKALATLPRPRGLDQGLAITLEKNLPVAAGLGGGSADAGAVFRLVERLHGLPDDWQARAAKLGADVPSCVRSEMAIGLGTGTELLPVENDLAGTPVLLVNPRITLSTASVFKAWEPRDLGPLPKGPASQIMREGRNDLRAPAIAQCTAIADVLDALGQTEPLFCEMSGSGATCFALFETLDQRDETAQAIAQQHPDWWQLAG